MPRFRCYHCPDLRPGHTGRFREFTSDEPRCPQCGPGDAVHELVDVHFLAITTKGPLLGHGVRYHVACEPKREYLGHPGGEHYAATPDPRAVTCPRCCESPAWKEAASKFKELKGGFRVSDPGCC